MSTRCQVVVRDSFGDEIMFYRHSDGYPEGAMPTLQKFMGWVRRGIIRDNAEQSSGWLILIGAQEYSTELETVTWEQVPKDTVLEPNEKNKISGWKCGAYEPAVKRHGNIEYLYVLDLKDKTIACYKTGFDGEGPVNDTLLFTDSETDPWTDKEE